MKRSPLKRRSKKMQAKYDDDGDDGRIALVKRLLKERPVCEAGARIGGVVAIDDTKPVRGTGSYGNGWRGWRLLVWKKCTRRARDVHEVLARSAGGDILDEKNCLCVCRNCRDWIGNNPAAATRAGLRKSRYR